MPKKTLDQIERSLKRLHSRLKRTVNAIDKLERAKRRLAKADTEFAIKNAPPPKPQEPLALPVAPTPPPAPADLELPSILDRRSQATKDADRQRLLDLNAAEEIKAEIDAKKKAKAKGRIAKMKAKQAGETRKMPLTGKAALDYIRRATPGA